MNLTAAAATSSLTATARATSPSVSWKERIGQAAMTVDLENSTAAYEIAGTFQQAFASIALSVADGSYTLENNEASYAGGTLILAGNAVADQTVTIGTTVYSGNHANQLVAATWLRRAGHRTARAV